MSDEISLEAASIPADLALIKVENETMMSAAAARPRDLEKIAEGLAKQIKAFPEFAEKVIYSRPVGKDESGEMKFATGLSIRAAESIAEAYGFNRVWSEIRLMPDGNAQVSASFTDFQRCRVTTASILVSRTFKTRKGQMRTHDSDRFLDVVCKAAQSKVIRDVIIRSVPPSLKASIELAARGAVRLGQKTVDKILERFGALGVSPEELETLLGAEISGWSDHHRQRLLEIYTAISEEETTVEDVFGARTAKEPEEAPSAVKNALTNPVEAA